MRRSVKLRNTSCDTMGLIHYARSVPNSQELLQQGHVLIVASDDALIIRVQIRNSEGRSVSGVYDLTHVLPQ